MPGLKSPCQACGACCAYSADWPRFGLETQAQIEAIPRALVDDARGTMRCTGDRCVALVRRDRRVDRMHGLCGAARGVPRRVCRAMTPACWRGRASALRRLRRPSLQCFDRGLRGLHAGAIRAMRGGEIALRAMLAGEEQPPVHRRANAARAAPARLARHTNRSRARTGRAPRRTPRCRRGACACRCRARTRSARSRTARTHPRLRACVRNRRRNSLRPPGGRKRADCSCRSRCGRSRRTGACRAEIPPRRRAPGTPCRRGRAAAHARPQACRAARARSARLRSRSRRAALRR